MSCSCTAQWQCGKTGEKLISKLFFTDRQTSGSLSALQVKLRCKICTFYRERLHKWKLLEEKDRWRSDQNSDMQQLFFSTIRSHNDFGPFLMIYSSSQRKLKSWLFHKLIIFPILPILSILPGLIMKWAHFLSALINSEDLNEKRIGWIFPFWECEN